MYQSLLRTIDDKSLVLTANQRLCAHLTAEYAKTQKNPVFKTPPITALTPWLVEQWEASKPRKRLLNSSQVHFLWQTVIENSEHTDFILPTSNISELANDAYAQMHGWVIPWDELETSQDHDHQTFLHWVHEFEALLEIHEAITAAHLPGLLSAQIDSLTFPPNIYLVGFQDMPPALSALLKKATHITPPSRSESIHRTESKTALTELSTMAQWAKTQLDNARKPIRIACVIPDLQSMRKQAGDAFYHVFREACSPMTSEAIFPFNISAGISLLDYPLIRDGYQTLTLMSETTIDIDELRKVLGSPYLFSLEDGMIEASEFDYYIRDQNIKNFSPKTLQQQLIQYPALQKIGHYLSLFPTPLQFPSEWGQFFIAQLDAVGWPGSQSLSSEEYQLFTQWNEQLQTFSQLDNLSGPISWHRALTHWHYLLKSTRFQPQTDHSQAPIQVLGLLEAVGLPFDDLWIMGLDDSAWPPPSETNPFIPIYLQKKYKLPHNSPEHEFLYAKNLQTTLLNHATKSLLSSSTRDNNAHKRASALISQYPLIATNTDQAILFKTTELEDFDEDYAPPLKEGEPLRGGSAIPANQASCPFRAFALHRLGSKSPRQLSFGISPLTHGVLLHNILENIWRELKNHEKLLSLSEEKIRALVEKHVKQVMAKTPTVPNRFQSIEKLRLVESVNDWLHLERKREPFRVIAIEKTEKIIFSGHEMRVRLDRIDQLDDGSKIILDYKTSRVARPNDWLASPPLHSQLPFYACFSKESPDIQGCAYALINRDGCQLRGYAGFEQTKAIPLEAIETASKYQPFQNWLEAVHHWREALEETMNVFIAGYAAVSPNPSARPCDTCELKSLCRIEEIEIL